MQSLLLLLRKNLIVNNQNLRHFFTGAILSALCLLIHQDTATAQTKNLYAYQELSNIYYGKQKDSLSKNWVCPVVSQNKATQKKYKEIWDSRTSFVTDAIAGNNFIHEQEIYQYISDIIAQIAKGNSDVMETAPLLLIDRSASVNAYATGGNLVAVNLGLISYAQTREDIALVIAHELSHNILHHAENAMKEKAEWLTSDEYNASLQSVLSSKYERFSRLKKVLEGYSFNRSRHQRYHESDADSLAIVLLNNSHIAYEPSFFLRLDSADNNYQQPLKKSLATYFGAYGLPYEESWQQKRSRGLSTRNYSFKDTTGVADSLKTHPDCIERYRNTLSQATPGARLTPVPAAIRGKANKMLIWNMFDGLSLMPCLYRVLQEKDNGNTDEWYDMMMYNIFSGLYYSDKQLNRFNAIGITQKEYISQNYYELQTALEQMPRETMAEYCHHLSGMNFWQNMPADAKALRTLFNTLNFNIEAGESKDKDEAARLFTNANASSMYCEFADHFKKK